ncbi:hypothetical protein CAPTEDRAFT_170410 [Capitella teleta]|uniref:Large ribosomal subunit protein uL24m n=1 Tax=Capitella teleta TaxID=283909 RepID=R7U4K7_CAPTE|nr:hypothetical protein CAPTEDRAFT_170410 [Capitella teleta]|eukprot:ELU00889.1 hypothetical protein CAPTEDRAFT_170410 [Capitella teleta]
MRLTLVLCRRAASGKYFQRYIENFLESERGEPKWNPLRGWHKRPKENWIYDKYRPWTDEFKRHSRGMLDAKGRPPVKPLVKPIDQWNIFKGDVVEILIGKDKGKIGVVNSIIKERNWVYVEGLNCEFNMIDQGAHMSPLCQKTELPLIYDLQVKLADPTDSKGTNIEWRYSEEGKLVRVSLRTGRIIPVPLGFEMGDDLVVPAEYKDSDKDTSEKLLKEVTFKPKVMTFEDEIMDAMGIKEERKRAKTYWY